MPDPSVVTVPTVSRGWFRTTVTLTPAAPVMPSAFVTRPVSRPRGPMASTVLPATPSFWATSTTRALEAVANCEFTVTRPFSPTLAIAGLLLV